MGWGITHTSGNFRRKTKNFFFTIDPFLGKGVVFYDRLIRVGTNKPTIFIPKFFLRYIRYYPPQTDILSLYKGGYGGEGGYTPMPEGGQVGGSYPHLIPTPYVDK